MRRLFTLPLAIAITLTMSLPVLGAGRHSGPEELAKGRGSVEFVVPADTVTLIGGEVCRVSDADCFFIPNIAVISVTTFVSESFDFDARVGPQTSPEDLTDGPHGQIKLTYQATTRTSLRLSGIGGVFCTDPAYYVTTPCPEPSESFVTESGSATASVTCLTVVQNRASIGGHVTRWSGDLAPTRGILLNVTDNTIARQQPAPDRFLGAFVTDVPYECPPPAADHPITKGDIYVDQS